MTLRNTRWLALTAGITLAASSALGGSTLLTWTPPSTNTDGSALTDLAGYRIFHGCSHVGDYPNSVDLNEPMATQYQLGGLPDSGTCYFVVSTRNVGGVLSVFSNTAQKVMGPGTVTAPGKASITVQATPSPPIPPPTTASVTLSAFDDASPSPEMTVTITGAGSVQVAVLPASSFWDWCAAPGPTLGGNDSKGQNAVTFTAPITVHCDVDGTQAFAGGNVTVAGTTKALVRAGSTWSVSFP